MNDLEVARRVQAAEAAVARLPNNKESASALSSVWLHSAKLSTGELVGGGKPLDLLEAEFRVAFDPLPVAGASVLDIGAWHGSFSFEAERLGAARVVAADHYTWFNEMFSGLETFLFLRRDRSSSVTYFPATIEQTTVERLGTFDIVLFLGVFYHLPDPLACLAELAKLANPWLVLETHCDLIDDPLPAMRYYPGVELGGDGSNWWGPNPPCVVGMLKNAGFQEVTVTRHPIYPGRFFFHARK